MSHHIMCAKANSIYADCSCDRLHQADLISEAIESLHAARAQLIECQRERDQWEQACTLARSDHNVQYARANNLKIDRDRLRAAIDDYLKGNYLHPRSYRAEHKQCPHSRWHYQDCEQCIEDHFAKALAETKL